VGKVVGVLAGLLAAAGGEKELGEVAEGGSFSKRPISCRRSALVSSAGRGLRTVPWERQ